MSTMMGVKQDNQKEFGDNYKELYYKNLTLYRIAKEKADKIKV